MSQENLDNPQAANEEVTEELSEQELESVAGGVFDKAAGQDRTANLRGGDRVTRSLSGFLTDFDNRLT